MLLTLLLACAGGEVDWALNEATAQPDATGLQGTHLWTFFPGRWERKQREDLRVCYLMQDLTGDVIGALDGCLECVAMYSVELTPVDSDCGEELADDPAYQGIVAVGIGSVHPDIAHLDPHPERSLGWYLSFDGERATAHGFVYPEALDRGGDPPVVGWSADGLYTFAPAYAWDL